VKRFQWMTSPLLLALLTPTLTRADLAQGLDAAAREDWATAYREFKESALRGNANAAVNLGNLYMRGLGVPQDYAQARAWYEKAALESNPIGEAKLGVLYYLGLGVDENRTRAAEWFQKAGDQGDAHSAMTLGEMYLAGDGVPQSRTEAYVWYTIASELGYREAEQPRIKLAAELPGAEISAALERVDIWRKSYAAGGEGGATDRQENQTHRCRRTHAGGGPSRLKAFFRNAKGREEDNTEEKTRGPQAGRPPQGLINRSGRRSPEIRRFQYQKPNCL